MPAGGGVATVSGAVSGAAANADGFAAAHARLLADGSVQFDLPPVPPVPPPPSWLPALIQWLGRQGTPIKWIFWTGVAVVSLLLLRAIWQWLAPRWRRGTAIDAAEPEWRPEAGPARALLAEADALAAQGQFAEAAHLVLLRSVEQIAARRPDTLRPALTSRDIARAPSLPGDVAHAFALIADVVEAGLFGGRVIGFEAWTRCRNAYEAMALPRAWA